tara:strand:+ start:1429 stop:3249 length:1821 start_codon:yes stop_codon:yes gene_type:complete
MEKQDWYLEYATGNVSNRNHLCRLENFPEIAQKHAGGEVYRSMFLYSPDIVAYVAENDTVTGFNGIQAVDKIVIDIDYVKDRTNGDELTIKAVLDLLDAMEKKEIWRDVHYQIWFSGTGFHIHLGNVYGFEPSINIAKQVRATMQRDWGEYIDLIYDSRRLIRAGYSYNTKSALFKIPVTYLVLENSSYAEITEDARRMNGHAAPTKIKHGKIEGLDPMDMSRKNVAEVRKVFDNAKGQTSRYITCAQHIYNAGYVPKNRHKHLLALASIWRKKWGLDKHGCDNLARAYMARMDEPLPAEETSKVVSDVFKSDYNYGCNHPTLEPYCDSKCILFKYKNLDETAELLNAEDMINKLLESINSDYTDRSFNLQEVFPFLPQKHMFNAGQLITLIGDTGLGKTAFIQYLIVKLKKIKTLFFSLEVDDETMSRRFVQASLNMTKEETLIKLKDPEVAKRAIESISHISLQPSSPDIQDLGAFISESEAKIVVIDTIDRVPAKYAGKDDFARQEIIANGLKDIAMKEDVIILAVHHISKSASYGTKEGQRLDVHSGKGNSAIEQKSDQYISFEGVERSKIRTIESLKARDESHFKLTVNYNWETFSFDKLN